MLTSCEHISGGSKESRLYASCGCVPQPFSVAPNLWIVSQVDAERLVSKKYFMHAGAFDLSVDLVAPNSVAGGLVPPLKGGKTVRKVVLSWKNSCNPELLYGKILPPCEMLKDSLLECLKRWPMVLYKSMQDAVLYDWIAKDSRLFLMINVIAVK